jgi:adenylate kinase family enzyme
MQRKILIMGLPGAGKTSLARQLAPIERIDLDATTEAFSATKARKLAGIGV